MNCRSLCHFAFVLCLAFALAACGDDESTAPTTGPGTGTATADVCETCAAGTVCDAAGQCVELSECSDTCESAGFVCGTICGMSCGQCGDGLTCSAGACVAQPQETGTETGTETTDACGGACGAGTSCVDGACVADSTGGGGSAVTNPVCGDGACNGTETCLTCEGDCGACPDNTKWLCYQILNECAGAACLDVPEAQLQTCFNTELNNCISNAASTEEATNFSNWLTCLQTCLQSAGGQNASNEDILQCYMYGCPDENAECHSGGTYGTENCLELTQCAACANTASSTECWRPCFEKATPDAINDFMAVQLCISDACAALPVAEQQACIQTALGAGGACETEGVKCEGGTTTEPAACEPACAEGETCVEGVCQADATEPAACEPACAEGETCVEGVCEAPACTPACSDVICSMDGCGGVCGACDATDMSTAVTIASFAFSPDSIKVAAGTTVIWTNEDSAQHNVVSMAADGSVDAAGVLNGPLLGQGESFSFTFSDAGSFDYRCAPHASMTGAVEVVAP